MEKTLLILLLMCSLISSNFGRCDENNSISLVKLGKRDWIKDYDKLFKKYKTNNNESVSSLRVFFYTEERVNECISFKELQKLDKKLQEISASIKSDDDVKKFMVAVKNAANKNKPAIAETQIPVVKNEKYSTKDSISTPIERTVTESNLTEELNQDNFLRVKERNKLKEEISIWFRISIGLMTLLISSILYMYWYFSKKIEEKNESSQNTLKEQSLYFNKILKELEVKNRENRNSFREAASSVEIKKDITVSVEESKQTIVPVLPKVSETIRQFYLANPTSSNGGLGFFRDIRQSQESPTNSFYRFVLEEDETKAKFWFLNNQNTIQSAIYYPETYIIPACEYTGLNSKVIKVTVETPGTAKKVGDNWQVQTKSEIRFE